MHKGGDVAHGRRCCTDMQEGGDIAHGRRCRTDMQEGGDIAHGRGRRMETHAGDAGSVGARTTPAGGGVGRPPAAEPGLLRCRARRRPMDHS